MIPRLGRVKEALRVLRWSRREQKAALLGAVCFGGIALVKTLPLNNTQLDLFTWVLVALGSFAWGLAGWRLWRYSLAPPQIQNEPRGTVIKGASPYVEEDAHLFLDLGRMNELNELVSSILDDRKPLIVVMGESGVGKTSLVRAGITLIIEQGRVQLPYCYWEASSENSEASFTRSLQAQLVEGHIARLGPAVIVLDQVEQLDRSRDAAIFDAISAHLTDNPPFHKTLVIAFRREFAPEWIDFLLSMPERFRHRQKIVSLHPFTIAQASRVFATLAEHAHLHVHESVADNILNQIADDGAISPVDLGITLHVLNQNPDLPDNPRALRSYGGHAGLLTSYLESVLDPYQPVVEVRSSADRHRPGPARGCAASRVCRRPETDQQAPEAATERL